MTDMTDMWQRLEAWGGANAPKMLEDLNPGATDEQIADLQQRLGRELPTSFVASLKIHNGESDGWPSKVFADMGASHPSDAIVEHWQMRQQIAEQVGVEFSDAERAEQLKEDIISVDGPVRPDFYHRDWIPIMDCNGDVFWALDFAPTEGGEAGQVIQVDLEGCDWKVIAPSYEVFFAAYVTSLEAGEFPIVEGLPSKEER